MKGFTYMTTSNTAAVAAFVWTGLPFVGHAFTKSMWWMVSAPTKPFSLLIFWHGRNNGAKEQCHVMYTAFRWFTFHKILNLSVRCVEFKFAFCGIQVCIEKIKFSFCRIEVCVFENSSLRFWEFKFVFCGIQVCIVRMKLSFFRIQVCVF